jgi:hypothetical protein
MKTVLLPAIIGRSMLTRPAMCPGGNVTSDTSSGAPAIRAGMVRSSASTVLWVCCAPFDTEVVPEVYASRQTSSANTLGRW